MPYTNHDLPEERAMEELGVTLRRLRQLVARDQLTMVWAGKSRLYSRLEVATLKRWDLINLDIIPLTQVSRLD